MNDILNVLKALASTERAKSNAWFFKTGPGQYGEGDQFWGITVPQVRQVVKQFKDLPLNKIVELLRHPVHEVRLCAVLLMVSQYKKNPEAVYKAYLANAKYINNWDLVDSSAEYIVGPYLENKSKNVLTKLAKSDNLWERRIAMISCFHYVRQGNPEESFKIAEILINDPHDLIQKAVGWMLREIGKKSGLEVEEQFLQKHAATMPRTTLRYALEHFPALERKHYLEQKSKINALDH